MSEKSPIAGSGRTFDWNLLHTFVVLAEAGSITGAAERLGRKQPTVSNALRRLEDQIGKKLIERSPGMFRLTDAGQLLHREAIDIYGSITRLSTLMRDVMDEVRGHVRIAMASHVVCPLFDDSLRAFHAANPKATFSLDVMASVTALAEVVARRASLAVCLVHERSAKLEYRRLYREYFGLFCGPGHPLFGQSGLSSTDLKGHSSISFLTDRLDDVLRPVALIRAASGLDQHVVGRSSHLEEIRRMTIAGLGIGALPVHAVARDIASGLLWRLPPYDDPPAIDVHLAWNPMARMNRAEEELLAALKRRIDETPIEQRTYA
ncbi:MAG: LysR family transcriptional regulator [Hyphomicrobiales bacterium]|nr:MAG: LysR family transcriptional regulator [Hyphomicrobiales bacterium]